MSCCGVSRYMNGRAPKGMPYEPTSYEHLANTLSHAIGILPTYYAFNHMISVTHRDLQYYLMVVYGFFTTLLFVCSSTYHFFDMLYRPEKKYPRLRYVLHVADRAAIYLFIAASYTPWLSLRHCGCMGVHLKWMIWLFAFFGILYQYNFHERYKTLETCLYILIAGGPSVAIFSMTDRSGLNLMVYGGMVYLVGVVFFKLDGIIPFAHAIWHLHVLVGAFFHTYAVYSTLLGPDRLNPAPDEF